MAFLKGLHHKRRGPIPRRAWMVSALVSVAVLLGGLTSGPVGAITEFSDINDAGGHQPAIDALQARDILSGTECRPREFCPNQPIKRWVMAVWLVRSVDESEPMAIDSSRFSDVNPDEWWAPYVERLADLGITLGCATSPARYCPTEAVTRAQTASFLVRAFHLTPRSSSLFTDTKDTLHSSDIDTLVAAGLTAGCATNPARYCPSTATTRGEMATFLARALHLVPLPSDRFLALTAGWDYSCGLRTDQTITCWGNNEYSQATAPKGAFTDLTGRYYHSCGLRTDQTITCWGNNPSGQADPPEGAFIAVSTGGGHSCGLRTDQTITCWGQNENGQATPPPGKFAVITAGEAHSCGLRTNQTVTCWGQDRYGEATPPSGRFVSVAAGGDHSCGVRTNGTVTCWGQNNYGDADPPDGTFTKVAVRSVHSCGIRTDQTVTCWGDNGSGQTDAPQGTFTSIATGWKHTCGIRTNQAITCWGRTLAGPLPNGVHYSP